MPEYYALADGRQFIDFQAERLVQFVGELDAIETHCLLSAAEHLFRKGRKPGTGRHDENAQEWWLGQARSRYMSRKRREWKGSMFPKVKVERKFDLIVQNVFGNTIKEKDKYLALKGSIE